MDSSPARLIPILLNQASASPLGFVHVVSLAANRIVPTSVGPLPVGCVGADLEWPHERRPPDLSETTSKKRESRRSQKINLDYLHVLSYSFIHHTCLHASRSAVGGGHIRVCTATIISSKIQNHFILLSRLLVSGSSHFLQAGKVASKKHLELP